jgi:membrane protein involved in colicin uptake
MVNRNSMPPEERRPEEAPKIMQKPLPQILDEMDENIRAAAEAARRAEEAARAAKESAKAATKASTEAEKRAEEARLAGEKTATEAARVAAEAISQVEKTVKEALELGRLPYFIEEAYNKKKLNLALGYCSPSDFAEQQIDN